MQVPEYYFKVCNELTNMDISKYLLSFDFEKNDSYAFIIICLIRVIILFFVIIFLL